MNHFDQILPARSVGRMSVSNPPSSPSILAAINEKGGKSLHRPSNHLLANHAVSAGFSRARVSIRVLMAEIDRSTTLRDSGVR